VDTPSPWLVAHLNAIPRERRVLDVACGRGRHTRFLAAQGWDVLAIDRDADALAALEASTAGLPGAVTTACVDLEAAHVALGTRHFGGVLVFNYLHRPLIPALVAAVAPDGVLVYETFTIRQAERGKPTNPAFLLHPGELRRLVAPLEVVAERDGDFEGAWRASILARRRTADNNAPGTHGR
jgi:SAM-dependent methyltransferase